MRLSPTGSHILTFVPRWWRCLRELLGDVALLEEGLQWGLALRVYSLGPLPAESTLLSALSLWLKM